MRSLFSESLTPFVRSKNKVQRAFSLIELLVIVIIITILVAILLPAIRAARSGGGDIDLNKAPKESRRVYHRNGMSIICPEDWSQEMRDNEQTQEIALFGTIYRHMSSIDVIAEKCEIPEQVPSKIQSYIKDVVFQATTFQDEPAFEYVERPRIYNGSENPFYIEGKLYFFRGGHCYLLRYWFSRYESKAKIPENLKLYLESFRAPEIPSNEEN